MEFKYLKDVVKLKLNRIKCHGCGMCLIVCPHHVYSMKEKRALITNIEGCIECGACAKNCPFGAIEVKPGVG